MKAIILARVSTEEQREAGNSLPAQQDRLISYINKSSSLELIKQFIFDESAFKEHRKEFDKILDFIRSRKEVVALCCDKVDRLSRDFLIGLPALEKLRRDGKIELHFPSDNLVLAKDSPATDLFHFNIAVSLAQYYSNSISDNVKRAFEKKMKNGEVTGMAPLGYKNVDDGKGGRTVEPDSLKAPFVIKIFELYASGMYSMQMIAEILMEEGLKNKHGYKVIRTRHIEYVLKNPFYYGFQNHKGQLYPHKYKPLISHDLFLQCKKVREGYAKKPTKYSTKPLIFRGLIKCARCGCSITPEMAKKKYVYYHCTNFNGNCEKVYINEKELVKPILSVLRGLQPPQQKIDEITESLKIVEQSKNKYHADRLRIYREEYDKIDKRLSVLYDDRCDRRITTDMYDKKLIEYKERQDDLLFKMKQLENANHSYYTTANQVLSVAKRAEEIFESSEPEEKRQFLKFLFQNLSLDGKNLSYKLKTPFEGVLLANTSHNWGG